MLRACAQGEVGSQQLPVDVLTEGSVQVQRRGTSPPQHGPQGALQKLMQDVISAQAYGDTDDLIYDDIHYFIAKNKAKDGSQDEEEDAPREEEAHTRDSKDCVYFTKSIFCIRCSTSQIPPTEDRGQYIRSIWLRDLLFHNAGSYPTPYNEVDAYSWKEQYLSTTQVFAKEFNLPEISTICQYLGQKDIIQFRLLNKKANQAALIAISNNLNNFNK